MRLSPLLLLVCMAALISACDNDNVPMVAPKGSPSYFRNDLNQTAYVNILYTPGQPGISFTKLSLLRQITVPAGATVPLGDEQMQTDKPYILDWHSADYTYSNFLLRLPANYSPFNYYPMVSDSTVVLNGKASPARLYCLDGDGKATHWASVGAYNANGVSVWDTLMSKKHHSVYMDLMGNYRDTARLYPGQVTFSKNDVVQTNYYVPDTAKFMIRANDYTLTNDLRPLAPVFTTSTDTLYLLRRKQYPGPGPAPVEYELPYIVIAKTSTVPLK